MLITGAAAAGREGKRPRQQHHGGDQAARARRCSSRSARRTSTPTTYVPFAPNGFTGIHQGAAIVFFAYIGFDAISTAAEETKNPQRNLPIGILGGLAICTVIYVIVGFVLTGHGAVSAARGRRSAGARARSSPGSRPSAGSWRSAPSCRCPRSCSCSSTASRASSSRWRATACCRSGPRSSIRRRGSRSSRRSSPASSWRCWSLIGDAGETYDLTNIGTLFAFLLVSIGVLVLRYTEPDRPRPFRVPFVWGVTLLSARRPACSS